MPRWTPFPYDTSAFHYDGDERYEPYQGKVHGNQGETIRTCIHAPEGPIEIEL